MSQLAELRPRSAQRGASAARVLHVGPDVHGPGGMPAAMRTLLASSLSEDHELTFAATHSSAEPLPRLLAFARGVRTVAVWCLRPGPRIVHVHVATDGSWYRKAMVVGLARFLRRPVVLHFHSGVGNMRAFAQRLGPARRMAIGAAFRTADEVVAVSAASAREVERSLGLRDVRVVPNATPFVAPEVLAERDPHRPVTVVYLGGFANPAKGGHVLLDALPGILKRSPELQVVLAGPGEPPARAQVLLSSPRVRWMGYLDAPAKAEVLRDASVFVMPSVSEGMPVALLEALAYGLPIVATRVGGIPEVVTDGETASLVDAEEPEALEEAVTALVADPERRERLGAAGRARADGLSATEVFAPIAHAYRELGVRGPGRRALGCTG